MKKLLAVGICSVLVACSGGTDTGGGNKGGGDKGGGDTGGATVKSADLLAAYKSVICQEYACYLGYSPTSADACPVTDDALAPLQKSLDAGRTKLDQAKAKACVAAAKSANGAACWGENGSTADIDAAGAACDGAIVGTVAVGGDCYDSSECAASWCDLSNNACPGKCSAPKAADAACGDDSECQSGLSCLTDYSDYSSKCHAPLAKGDDCSNFDCPTGLYCNDSQKCDDTRGALGDSCQDSAACPTGSFCYIDPDTYAGTCEALAHAGGACDDPGYVFFQTVIQAQDCAGQQVCVGGQGDGSKAGKCATPADLNGACTPGDDAGPGGTGCFQPLACDTTTSKCLLPPTTAGAACVGGACGGDLLCDPNDKCQELPTTAGADCLQQQCGADLLCDSTTSKCAAAPTEAGSACVESECGTGLYCDDNNQCQPLPAAGSPCAGPYQDECADGAYCDFTPDTPACAAKKANGEDCSSSDECLGTCDDATSKCVDASPSAGTCEAP